jgi:hypothetical protein
MRHIRYYVGMKAKIGPNFITFCSDPDGPYIKVDGPDAADSGKCKDSKPPKRKPQGRLVERGPRIVSLALRGGIVDNMPRAVGA